MEFFLFFILPLVLLALAGFLFDYTVIVPIAFVWLSLIATCIPRSHLYFQILSWCIPFVFSLLTGFLVIYFFYYGFKDSKDREFHFFLVILSFLLSFLSFPGLDYGVDLFYLLFKS